MSLHVLDPGLYSLVVDLGRPGFRGLGVPLGGAADRSALILGNAMVGNAPGAAGLEICLAGPSLRAGAQLACVVFGAPFDVTINGRQQQIGTTFTLQPGDELRTGTALRGMRAYLCVQGGIQWPQVLGSNSGLEPIQIGTVLECSPGSIHRRFLAYPGLDRKIESLHTPYTTSQVTWPLRILPGLQANWFHADAFLDQEYTILPASNRMGLRLQGRPLDYPDREMVSEPVCPGTVQITRDGQCIVLGVDSQTIGGYPKVAQVVSTDLDYLGQLRPGDRVRFHMVTLEESERLARRRHSELKSWSCRLRVALTGWRPAIESIMIR
jgi:biotin-dependent carboxylase-like uncharacterized protein